MDAHRPDAELGADVVGVASARLRAAGVPAGERLAAMRLLSVLLTLADEQRRVRRPLAMVASEFDLPLAEARRSLDHLGDAGALDVAGGVVTLVAVEQQRGGFTLHDFLDAVDDLDRRRDERRVARRLRPAVTALAAAAAVAALALVVPGLAPEPGTPVSTERDVRVDAPVPGPAAAQDPSPAPADPVERTITDGTPAPRADAAGRTRPRGSDGRRGPAPTAPPAAEPVVCPDGVPLLELTGTRPAADGTAVVDGVVRNPTGATLTVHGLSVTAVVAGQPLRVPASAMPLVVGPGAAQPWSVHLPVVEPEGPPSATLDDWEWEPPVPVTCPSP